MSPKRKSPLVKSWFQPAQHHCHQLMYMYLNLSALSKWRSCSSSKYLQNDVSVQLIEPLSAAVAPDFIASCLCRCELQQFACRATISMLAAQVHLANRHITEVQCVKFTRWFCTVIHNRCCCVPGSFMFSVYLN